MDVHLSHTRVSAATIAIINRQKPDRKGGCQMQGKVQDTRERARWACALAHAWFPDDDSSVNPRLKHSV